MRAWLRLLGLALLLGSVPRPPAAEDVHAIVQRWTDASRRNFDAAQRYSYVETIRNDDGAKTYVVTMLVGCPYRRLVQGDGHSLEDEQNEALEQARQKRARESPDERQRRLTEYQKNRKRAQGVLEELPRAFDYALQSTRQLDWRTLYVLTATPRRGYDPPNDDARVLTGMQGEFWIDAKTYQLVHGRASVLHPVPIDGFLATVEPGTQFEIDQRPVDDGIWLPAHVSIQSRSSIVFVFHHRMSEDRTYFNYHKPASDP